MTDTPGGPLVCPDCGADRLDIGGVAITRPTTVTHPDIELERTGGSSFLDVTLDEHARFPGPVEVSISGTCRACEAIYFLRLRTSDQPSTLITLDYESSDAPTTVRMDPALRLLPPR